MAMIRQVRQNEITRKWAFVEWSDENKKHIVILGDKEFDLKEEADHWSKGFTSFGYEHSPSLAYKKKVGIKQFKTKPVEIEAVQFDGTEDHAMQIVDWMYGDENEQIEFDFEKDEEEIFIIIKTEKGTMEAKQGDFIIRGIDGDFYPVKSEIFRKTHTKGFYQ